MDNKELAKHLIKLAQLDIDAIRAYDQALANIDNDEVFRALSEFKGDHQQHVTDLSSAIRKLGEEPPTDSPDVKGFLLAGFTAIRSMTGTEGALNAMESNEQLTNKTYEDALKENLSADIRTLVEKNFADEQRHLAYIQRALEKCN